MSKLHEKMVTIQSTLKAPKGQTNAFGKYKYRSNEDILEAVKPLLKAEGLMMTITDNIIEAAGMAVVNATIIVTDGTDSVSVSAQAGIDPNRKGMDIAQSFGSSSSYAKKYALGNLFLLDDTKDADSNKVNEPISKPEMTTDIYNIMLEFINTGKGSAVMSKMRNYSMSEKQESTLMRMLKQEINK